MTGRPSTQSYEQMLMQQRYMQQASLAAEQAAYSAQLGVQRATAAQTVQQQQSSMNQGIRKKIAKPVTLGTILTSPMGLLGNPVLSSSKLTG